MRFSDSGMISNYSRDNGAILMASKDALDLLQGGPPEGIRLSGIYDTRTTEQWGESFKTLDRKRNQALGAQKIISRFPALPPEPALRAQVLDQARTQKIHLKNVRVMIVPTLQAARDHARTLPDSTRMPFYVITAQKPNIFKETNANFKHLVNDTGAKAGLERSLAVFVRDVLAAQQTLEVVTFGLPKFAEKEAPTEISAQQLSRALGLETLNTSEIQLSRENGHIVFEVSAWGLQ